MTDIERAKQLLADNALTCALVKGETVYKSERRGVAPLLELLNTNTDVQGFSAADRVVGKAAALLYCLLGVHSLYAEVMCEPACDILSAHGIAWECSQCVSHIKNKTGDGLCPMESAVKEIDDPASAKFALEEKIKQMMNGKKTA